jgi:hypothetical protein
VAECRANRRSRRRSAPVRVQHRPEPRRRPRRAPRSRIRGDRRLARWRLSCAGERRTAPIPAARTPALPFGFSPRRQTPMITSIRQQDPGFGQHPARLFNPSEQHAGSGVIGSHFVRLSVNSARPARRSSDGQMILNDLPATQKAGPDLRFRGAPLRNRTVDLLLTMNPRQVPSPQVECADLAKHERTRALTGSVWVLASTILPLNLPLTLILFQRAETVLRK